MREQVEVTEKQCSTCRKEGVGPKPAEDFGKDKTRKDGLNSRCYEHARSFARQFYKDHAPERRALQRTLRAVRAGRYVPNKLSIALRGWGRCVTL